MFAEGSVEDLFEPGGAVEAHGPAKGDELFALAHEPALKIASASLTGACDLCHGLKMIFPVEFRWPGSPRVPDVGNWLRHRLCLDCIKLQVVLAEVRAVPGGDLPW